MPAALVGFSYLVAALLLIVGLKGLGHPRTAVRGWDNPLRPRIKRTAARR